MRPAVLVSGTRLACEIPTQHRNRRHSLASTHRGQRARVRSTPDLHRRRSISCNYLHDYTGIDIFRVMKVGRLNALPMKPLEFLGSSRDDLAVMPAGVRHDMGVELMRVQLGGQPRDFKPMASVGTGVFEIRVRDASGAYRVM